MITSKLLNPQEEKEKGERGEEQERKRQTPAFRMQPLRPNHYIFYTVNLTFITLSLLKNKPEPYSAKHLSWTSFKLFFLHYYYLVGAPVAFDQLDTCGCFRSVGSLKVEVICSITSAANYLKDEQQKQQALNDFLLGDDVQNSAGFQADLGADGGRI